MKKIILVIPLLLLMSGCYQKTAEVKEIKSNKPTLSSIPTGFESCISLGGALPQGGSPDKESLWCNYVYNLATSDQSQMRAECIEKYKGSLMQSSASPDAYVCSLIFFNQGYKFPASYEDCKIQNSKDSFAAVIDTFNPSNCTVTINRAAAVNEEVGVILEKKCLSLGGSPFKEGPFEGEGCELVFTST